MEELGVDQWLDGRTRLDKGGGGIVLPVTSVVKATAPDQCYDLTRFIIFDSGCAIGKASIGCAVGITTVRVREFAIKHAFHPALKLTLERRVKGGRNGETTFADC